MTRRVGGLIALGLLAFACGSDKSILVAGNDEASTTTPVSQTTIVNDPSRTPDATETTVEGQEPPTRAPTTPPATNATTTTTPLDTLPACPVDRHSIPESLNLMPTSVELSRQVGSGYNIREGIVSGAQL